LQDFSGPNTQAWFDGQVQKICSVAASAATIYFNRAFDSFDLPRRKPAMFDARVFTLPSRVETQNLFLWRQNDCRRNAIGMVAEAYYSPKELHGKTVAERLQMIAAKGVDINESDPRFLHGQLIERVITREHVEYVDKRTGETRRTDEPVERSKWERRASPDLDAQPGGYLDSVLPEMPEPARTE